MATIIAILLFVVAGVFGLGLLKYVAEGNASYVGGDVYWKSIAGR